MQKLEWCGYRMAKKFDDMFSRFDTILACERTDGQTSCLCIVCNYADHYAVKSESNICEYNPNDWVPTLLRQSCLHRQFDPDL